MQQKRIFISYKFTGEDKEKLKNTILQLYDSLDKAGHKYYSTILDSDQFASKKWSGKQIMEKAFKEMDASDAVLFFVNGTEISQGMLVELGYALAKRKKIILAINSKVKESIFRRQIENIIEFENVQQLHKSLSNLKID